MITAKNLSKRYGSKVAVDNVSFEVANGKVTGFLGPNGAGKSTTMRLMLGLDNGGGTTTFDGKLLHEYAQPSKTIGILLEAKAFHPTRTARNHLRVLAAAGNIADSRVDEALDMVGLREVGKKRPGKFSLGMSQRLGIAAAILGQPKYLMLDEPANGLDPEGIAWLRRFLREYAAQGNAVLVSSHLLSEMSLMADDVVVIGKGKLIASTSIHGLISGSSHSSIFIRTSDDNVLLPLLQKADVRVKTLDGGLEITGSQTDVVGKIAFDGGVAVYELTNKVASLEDAFLEITEGSQEYKAHDSAQAEKPAKTEEKA